MAEDPKYGNSIVVDLWISSGDERTYQFFSEFK